MSKREREARMARIRKAIKTINEEILAEKNNWDVRCDLRNGRSVLERVLTKLEKDDSLFYWR